MQGDPSGLRGTSGVSQGARGEVLGVPGGQGRRPLGPSGFKGYVRVVPGGQGEV